MTTSIRQGDRFGRLIVTGSEAVRSASKLKWACLCDCGTKRLVLAYQLKSGKTRSCGCYKADLERARGEGSRKKRPEYESWCHMNGRCFNKNHHKYARYGGRGITVCDRWRDSFDTFYADMGPRPTPSHSIDRINNNDSYLPENCRWATPSEQTRNSTTPRAVIRSDGKFYAVSADAALDIGAKPRGICDTCAGRQKTALGYGFRYAEPHEVALFGKGSEKP